MMKARLSKIHLVTLLLFFGLVLCAAASYPASAQLGRGNLQDLCEPIALYPDPLLSNVLLASTYPDQVSAAARWMNGPSQSASSLAQQNWDPAVKSLTAFPQVLSRMAQEPSRTAALGRAFQTQGPDVLDAIQTLRSEAQACGNLPSNSLQSVSTLAGAIVIAPTKPNVIYVPSYNSEQVYDDPQPAGSALSFGTGVPVDRFLLGALDWDQDRVSPGYRAELAGEISESSVIALSNR